MRAYVFKAALLCEPCGDKVKATLALPPDADPIDESSYDSDDYPKGPYSDGGGEADCPQHCDHCGTFLENPLTGEGQDYVREMAANRDSASSTVREWLDYYEIDA